jgi:hypothetical protein
VGVIDGDSDCGAGSLDALEGVAGRVSDAVGASVGVSTVELSVWPPGVGVPADALMDGDRVVAGEPLDEGLLDGLTVGVAEPWPFPPFPAPPPEVGVVVGVGVGVGVLACGSGLRFGGLFEPVCQAKPTYAPSGTLRVPTP